MTTKYFETKEQYFAFREAWARAVNHKKTKPWVETRTDTNARRDGSIYEYEYAIYHDSWITGAHMMLYNIIRGKDPQHGFKPLQRHSKIHGMGTINRGAHQAWERLTLLKRNINDGGYWGASAKTFVAPFGDTFTIEDFEKIEIPDVPYYSIFYGIGLKIAQMIFDGEFKPQTGVELKEMADKLKMEKAA